MNGTELQKFMSKSGIANVTPDSMQTYMKTMSKEAIDTYCAENQVLHGTIEPNEAIVTPFDCVFVEKVGRDTDVIGARINYWLKDEDTKMENLSRWYISVKKPNSWLQHATEALAAEEVD